jgi:hypothetical protein
LSISAAKYRENHEIAPAPLPFPDKYSFWYHNKIAGKLARTTIEERETYGKQHQA